MKQAIFLFCLSIIGKVIHGQGGYEYFLSPAEEMTIPVGAKLTLHVEMINADGNIVQAEGEFTGQWTVNGQSVPEPGYGSITHSLAFTTATYTAPGNVPSKNPVAIAVSFTPNDSSHSKITLVCNITITDARNYFFLGGSEVQKEFYEWDDTYLSSAAASKMAMGIDRGGTLVINVNGKAKSKQTIPAVMGMSLMIGGKQPGTYQWKLAEDGHLSTTATLMYMNDKGNRLTFASGDCLPHKKNPCQSVSLPGETTITDYNQNTGVIKGYFTGRVMTIDANGRYIYANTYGRFTVTEQKF